MVCCSVSGHDRRRCFFAHLPFAIVSEATSPLNRALCIIGISTSPETKLDVAWSLRILAWSEVWLCSDGLPVKDPLDLVLGPINSVVVHPTHRTVGPSHCRIFAVELVRVALTIEIVGNVCGVPAHDLNIDLVQIIAQENYRADDTLSTCSLEYDFHSSEHDIECRLNSDGIALFYNAHFSSIVGEAHQVGTSGEVEEVRVELDHGAVERRLERRPECRIVWTCLLGGVASRGCLS